MLQKQVITIPIAQGLDTKTDEFQVAAGNALTLENARFYKVGKLQKRFGFTEVSNTGSALSNIRAIVSDNEMINALTDSGVYSYSESLTEWSSISPVKETPKIKSQFVLKSAYNQYNPDIDIEESLGLAVHVFREVEEYTGLTSAVRYFLTVVMEDLNTGKRTLRKVQLTFPSGGLDSKKALQKVMITASGGVPHITVFYDDNNYTIKKRVFDKNLDDVGSVSTVATLTFTNAKRSKMDVCKDGSNIFFAYMYDTSLFTFKYDLTGTAVSSNSYTTTQSLGYDTTSDYGMGFSISQTSDRVHVFWVHVVGGFSNTWIVGLGVDKSLAIQITESFATDYDETREISIVGNGTNVHVAITEVNTSTDVVTSKISTATWTTSYSFSTFNISDYVARAVIISRPFVVNNQVYTYSKCPETNQNTGLLLNLSTLKFVGLFSPAQLSPDRVTSEVLTSFSTGTCNSVVYDNTSYVCAEKIFAINTSTPGAYDFNASIATARISSNFLSDEKSGTKTKLGETNYYTNGTTLAFDNRTVFETGFFLRPLIKSLASTATGSTTTGVASKNFSYIAVYNYYNSKGELERSIPSPALSISTAANTTYVTIRGFCPSGSYKTVYDSTNSVVELAPQVVLYRTTTGPGSTYYRVSSQSAGISDIFEIYDASADTDITDNEILYTTGNVLEFDPPPNAQFSTAGGNRLYLGGLEEEDEIAYSNKQVFGEMVSFSDAYRIRISSGTASDKTKLSALGFLDGKLIIFRENSVYYIAGDGPLDTGSQDTFTSPEVISSDTGCIEPRSVLNTPNGLLFKSKKGIYLLDRSLQVSYIGAPVEEFNDEKVIAAIVSDRFNEAKFYTENGNCLTYNYVFDQWSTSTGQSTVDVNTWGASPVQVLSDKVCTEDESSFIDIASYYQMKLKTPWLKLSGIQDFGRIWSIEILGKFKSAHTLRVIAYYDYETSYSETYDISPLVSDSQYQYRCHLRKQKCEAVQFEIQDLDQAGTGESMELSAITLEVGLRKGSFKLPASRKY
jgi:hypothetical protein